MTFWMKMKGKKGGAQLCKSRLVVRVAAAEVQREGLIEAAMRSREETADAIVSGTWNIVVVCVCSCVCVCVCVWQQRRCEAGKRAIRDIVIQQSPT